MFDPVEFMARLSGPPLLMGVLNVTPDSFSDGGRFLAPDAARAQAETMVKDGVDIIDIGGESTRPGHQPVHADEEIQRLAPVLDAVAKLDVAISIDTNKASVAAMALDKGADIVNDVWGLQGDPLMATLVAETGAPVICMHNRHAIDTTIDIVADVKAFLTRSMEIAGRTGVDRNRIVLDPGFGFGKSFDQSLKLLMRLDALAALDRPMLIGVSRKGFIGSYSGEPKADARLAGTLAANQIAAWGGHAAIIRAHDVAPHRQMLNFIAAAKSISYK